MKFLPSRVRFRGLLHRELGAFHPRLAVAGLVAAVIPQLVVPSLRRFLYRWAGVSIGARTLISGKLRLIGYGPIAQRLRIGSRCYFTTPLFIDLTGAVEIGDDVTIGHHVVIITARHEIGPSSRRAGDVLPCGIVVENGAWIGARATLLPGTHVGRGSVVAAGSVVTGNVPSYSVVAGAPARVVRLLDASGGRRRDGNGMAAELRGESRGAHG